VTALDSQQLTKLVVDVAAKEGATTIVFVHDATGKAVAPRVAAR
jgi:electron transfer flavoprotein alpha subunit